MYSILRLIVSGMFNSIIPIIPIIFGVLVLKILDVVSFDEVRYSLKKEIPNVSSNSIH